MEQAITESGAISANWGFFALAALANVLLWRLLSRIERKLESHDESINALDIIASKHEIRLTVQEEITDNWAKKNEDLADQIIGKLRVAKAMRDL